MKKIIIFISALLLFLAVWIDISRNGHGAERHRWGTWRVEKAATCTEAGLRRRYCADCTLEETEVIPISDAHAWGEWNILTPATCTRDGERMHTCTACNTVQNVNIPTDASAHTFGSFVVTTPATCMQEGVETRSCACGEAETRTIAINSYGHTFGEWRVVSEESCVATGVMVRACPCGLEQTADILVNRDKHLACTDWAVSRPAICTRGGEEFCVCTDCNTRLTRPIPVDPTAHSWGEWEVLDMPSCKDGSQIRVCKHGCDEEQIEAIPAVDAHAFAGGVCTVCGKRENE